MKILSLATGVWLIGTTLANAQEPPPSPLSRADASFVIGWQNLRKEQPPQPGGCCHNDWVNGIFYGAGAAGWYWTDNLKTQVDFGAGTKADQYRYGYVTSGSQSTTTSSRLTVQQQSLGLSQQYQFFRNQWFHPHVGAGVEIVRETTREQYQPVIVFDNVTHVSTQVLPARTEGPEHQVWARPFVETGFKAYLTRRAFFTGDARLGVRHGIDEVLFRAGFGIDF